MTEILNAIYRDFYTEQQISNLHTINETTEEKKNPSIILLKTQGTSKKRKIYTKR